MNQQQKKENSIIKYSTIELLYIHDKFSKALIDYERHFLINLIFGFKSTSGFCFYFSPFDFIYRPFWKKYETKNGFYSFRNRKERIEALKKIINDIENEIRVRDINNKI